MDFLKWAQQYREEAQRIRAYIKTVREEAKGNPEKILESRERDGRLYTLYGMYLECKHTADLLEEHAKRQSKGSV